MTIRLLALLALSSLAACRRTETDQLDQAKIFCQYQLQYQADLDETTARVYFRARKASGNALQLSEPSTIHFGTDPLLYDAATRSYLRVYSTRRDTGTFVWTDTDAKTYTNNIDLQGLLIDYPSNFPQSQISPNGDFLFSWDGTAVQNNEKVSLYFEATASNNKYTISTDQPRATSISIPSASLQELPVGEYRCILSRTKFADPQEATDAGASIEAIYSARPVNVVIQ